MKFSESWLREFVSPECTGQELSFLLTMAGFEVEEETTAAPSFDNVIVSAVLQVDSHPDAMHLSVCKVDTGQGKMQQIVCGAPSIAPGQKIPCALPGSVLPGNVTILATKVRGIESYGMLCSASELGISEDALDLLVLPDDAPVGENIRTYLDLDDVSRLMKLTPNRADCLSLRGIAREVAALTGSPLKLPDIQPVPAVIADRREIHLEAPLACPCYCGRIIRGVNAQASSPEWMRQRLLRCGVRPISALVDITNYVMLEMGQPLHAFDDAKLNGDIRVRMARPGEKIQLLNEQILELQSDVLVIADDENPIAAAGIMGGEETGITLNTQDLFLESAFFAPKAVAGRARRFGFASDASHRFERGVDFGSTRDAIERATQLVISICGGQPGPVVEAVAELPERKPVKLRSSRAAKVLGITLPSEAIATYFSRLNLSFTQEGDVFTVIPPSYRFDIEIEEDLIEEVARMHGYDNIPALSPVASLGILPLNEAKRPLSRLRQMLTDHGFQEVINFAFVDEAWEKDFSANVSPIRLANPIASTMSVMRSTLIGGLIANVSNNLRRKQNRIRLFEAGCCFLHDPQGTPVEGFAQPWRLAALIYGDMLPEQWGSIARPVDFYDIKGVLEFFLAPASLRFEKTVHPALHPGRSAKIVLNDQVIGVIGELHPQWQQKYELPLTPALFEVDLEAVMLGRRPHFSEISQQPPVIRDLAIVVDQSLELQQILDELKNNQPALVQEIGLFDVYTGKGVHSGKKSLAFRIVMQDTQRTLQDTDVDAVMQQLIDSLKQNFGAQLRV